MALTRLTNLIATRTGRMLYVNPDDFNATDLISNTGNSPTRPFKTLQRALLEVARFSYVAGLNNDKYDQFTINLAPGDYVIDNRPGKTNSAEVPELSDQSNFDVLDPNNDLYKFNSVTGGLVIPRGTSIVGMDLRKTRVRPRYVPEPTDSAVAKTSIFKVTGACYFWQFSLFDALPSTDSSGLGGVYNYPTATSIVNANYSHHKVTCFTYADQQDLNLFYAKASRAFASIPEVTGELDSRVQENRIVGPLQQAGQKPVSSISIIGSIATVTSSGPHEVFEGQQITIENVSGSYTSLNGTYYVQKVNSPSQFTFIVAGQPSGAVPSSDLTNAIVKAEIDTVDSSSPYIFNCSLRSTYGLCGLWADGSLVTGFKSMVVAQFTGVSLQKDDRAFIKFTETTTPNPSFVLDGGSSDAVALHQDSAGYVYYRGDATTGWRHYHIRVSNNAFIQSVSVFAVGYAEQHLIESGGDYSITNSNSNFGTQALIADGFRPDAFTLDKKGYISHIVPPQTLDTQETEVPYYSIDIQKSKQGLTNDTVGSELHLYEQTDPNNTPVFDINQYKLGGRISDKIFVNLTNPSNGNIQSFEAFISPNGIEEHTITSLNVADNLFTTQNTNSFETATPVRIYSSTGYLPLGMESNILYYVIKVTNNSFKIAPSAEDARAGAGGSLNSIVNLKSQIPLGAILTVKAYVSDTDPELPRFDVSVNANQDEFNTGTFAHGFTTGDKVFFKRRVISGVVSSGALPTIQSSGQVQNLSLTTEYYVSVINAYRFKIADSESNANNNIPISVETNGDVNTIKVYRNIQKSPLRFSPSKNNWYVSVRADITNRIHPILTSSSSASIYSNPALSNTENTYLQRISDDRANADRTYRLRYVIPKTELNSRPPLIGYVIKRRTDDNNIIKPYTTATASGVTTDFNRIYFIYRIDTILKHIPNEQEGIYYLTVLMADIAPLGSQFGSSTNTFNFLKYSQDVSKIYPDLDKDNPVGDPSAAVTVADNLIHGLVYQNNNRNSITKESITKFVEESGFTPVLSSLGGKATSGQENRLIPFAGNIPQIEVELRRTSQIRAGNQTFEYTGFGSGNYSTGFPSKQQRVLTDKEVLYSQAQRRRAGIVFYSGLNAYGDLYVGNQKINAVTGEVEILDKPILRVAGSAAVQNQEYVPYVSGTKNVTEIHSLTTTGGPNKNFNSFNNESYFNEGIYVAVRDTDAAINPGRALITSDVIYRGKGVDVGQRFLNNNVKQTGLLFNSNLRPNPGVEGTYLGDLYYKSNISSSTRHQSYTYTGQAINGGWALTGLTGVGHLTSIEDSYSQTIGETLSAEPYEVTGRFGINKVVPSGALHVGTGNAIIDNNLTIGLDLAVNGGDITSTAVNFNLLNQSTGNITAFSGATGNVNLANAAITADVLTSATDIDLGSSTGSFKIHNASVIMDGDLAVNGCDISTTCTNFNLLNQPTGTFNVATSATTVNAFTGATALNLAATTGTTTVRNNLQIDGNLRVSGTTTSINSTVTTIKDPIITLGGDTDNINLTSSDGKDRGIEFKYYDTSSKLGFIGWDASDSKYVLLKNAINSSEVFAGTDAELKVGKIRVTDASEGWIYDVNPFATFTGETNSGGGSYAESGNVQNVSTNFQSIIEKYSMPVGVITMWSGLITAIPKGWALCDGSTKRDRNGNSVALPDLRGKFMIGAGGTYTIGSTGGNESQTITTGTNSVTPTVSSTLSGSVTGHELTRSEIPQHRHGIDHYHEINDPGHVHTYNWISDANVDRDFGETVNDGRYRTDNTSSAFTNIKIKNLTDTYGAGNQNLWSGYGGARDSPDGLNSLGPSSARSDFGTAHTHSNSFSVSTTLSNTTHTHSFTIDTRPPYYALAFIFKL